MKILHIVRQFEPAKGGLENYVSDLAKRQKVFVAQGQGYDIHILSLDRVFGTGQALRGHEVKPDYTIKRVSFLGTRQCFLPFLNPFYVRDFDIIHIHGTDQLADMVAFYSLFMPLKHKLFFTTHGLFFHTESLRAIKELYLRTITRFTLSRIRRVFAVSGNDSKILYDAGISSQLMYNPINPIKNIRAVGQDFIYIGRISKNKNLPLLIDFYSKLREKNPDTGHLHIVGSDAENILPLLNKKVKNLNLDDVVHFHGFLSDDAMNDIIKKCRYNISASRYEGYGLAMVEGMSAGLLPVMNKNTAFEEIQNRSGVGLVTDFNNTNQAVDDFYAWNLKVTDKMINDAFDFAQAQSPEQMTTELDAFYQQAITENNKPYRVQTRYLCGLPVAVHTKQSALKKIHDAITSDKNDEHLRICFANTNLSVQLHNHPKRSDILKCFNMILNDGIGCDFASLITSGKKFPYNLNGTDFIPDLLKTLAAGTKIAIYGSDKKTIADACDILQQDYRMNVVSVRDGYMDIDDNYIQELKESDAKILIVARGNPLQESTILKLHESGVNIPVMVGVGALFDFMTHRFPRAPEWVQKIRCEWAFRLYCEPRRLLKRYTIDILYYLGLVIYYNNVMK
jgi:alpha-1,3-mannosyltransferase